MKVTVVGASGYIGRPVLVEVMKSCAARGTSSLGSDSLLPLQLEAADEFDYSVIQESEVVFMAAAISAPDVCAREHERAWAVNVTGTSTFISNALSEGARVVFFSSDTVYGERADEFDESTACNPAGEYAVMKREVETRFAGNPAFKTIRLSLVFAAEDKFTKYLRGCAERSEEADIFHPFYRAFVHRDDVVQGVIALARRWEEFPQSVINFGGPDVIARTEFAQTLKDLVLPDLRTRRIEPEPDFFANRPRIIRMKSPSLALLLGRPARSLGEAIELEFLHRGKVK